MQKLNSSQILPVKDTDGAVLVIAGAGSGKTRVLTSRIAYLISNKGVHPSNVLAITFTNKAADEMKYRLEKMIGDIEGMWVSTIHSMCVKILRSSISYLGYEKNFSIYSEDDKERVLKRIISDMELEADKYLKLCKSHISNAKNSDLSPREYRDENINMKAIGIIYDVYLAYENELKRSNALDFDDLLIKTLHLFERTTTFKVIIAKSLDTFISTSFKIRTPFSIKLQKCYPLITAIFSPLVTTISQFTAGAVQK